MVPNPIKTLPNKVLCFLGASIIHFTPIYIIVQNKYKKQEISIFCFEINISCFLGIISKTYSYLVIKPSLVLKSSAKSAFFTWPFLINVSVHALPGPQ